MVDSEKKKGPKTLPCVRQHHTVTLQLSILRSASMFKFSNPQILTLFQLTRYDV